jgi:type I restriction enzyme, S subunit
MMKDWKEIKLGEICSIKHGWAFKGEFFTDKGERIVVTPGNFFEQGGFRLQIGKEKFYSADFPKEYLLKKDDLVIAMTEQGEGLLGSPALIPIDNKFLHNQRIGLFQDLDENIVCKKFLYYLFFTKEVRGSIASTATGTKVKHTAPKRVYSIKTVLPPVETQQKIASILSAYDDLIENNLRRIKLLEEMAAITYKEWFVNFTIDGQVLEIDEETGLPVGWERKRFEDIFTISNGCAFESKDYTTEGTRILRTRDYSSTRFITYSENIFLPSDFSDKFSRYKIKEFDLMLIMVGASIGNYGIVLQKDLPSLQNQNQWAIRERSGYESYKFYKIIYAPYFINELLSKRTGAARDFFRASFLNESSIIVPSREHIDKLNIILEPIFSELNNLFTQNRLLKESRDILLPRLMNGEITV